MCVCVCVVTNLFLIVSLKDKNLLLFPTQGYLCRWAVTFTGGGGIRQEKGGRVFVFKG